MEEKKLQDDYQLSNKDIVEQAKQKYEADQVKESQFPTEIVELPSRGLLYSKDNPLSSGKVEMRYMTAREEDILTTQSYIKDGTVLDRLFSALIIGNGEGMPIKYVDLVVADKDAIMLAARILSYGKSYKVSINDPTTDEDIIQEETIDLTQFENEPYDGSNQVELNVNEFKLTLPHSEIDVTFKALTVSNERKIKHQTESLRKKGNKNKDQTSRAWTTRLKNIITSVDGETDQDTIDKFVDSQLLGMDSRALRKYMTEVFPKVNLAYEFVSDETGERREMLLPMDVSFFWPDSTL